MILYLGTSSLIKLYAEEPHSDLVRDWVKEAEIVATCRVAYTEVISALELRIKQNDLSQNDYKNIVRKFSSDWTHLAVVDFDERKPGLYVKKYGLTRFDAIHLSAAALLKSGGDDISVSFSSADKKLCSAAQNEGLRVLTFQ